MKKRFLALALVAIPLLSSCGKMKEVDYSTWKSAYDAAVSAKRVTSFSQIRIKGVGENGKFDSGYGDINNPGFVGDASTAFTALNYSLSHTINIVRDSGKDHTLLANGKEFGFTQGTLTIHYNQYFYTSYYHSDTLDCSVMYKK